MKVLQICALLMIGASAISLEQKDPAANANIQTKAEGKNKWKPLVYGEIVDKASATNSCVSPISTESPPYDCQPNFGG